MDLEKASFNWFPGHMNKAIKEIQKQIPVVDLIIEIVDARAPYSSQNPIFKKILSNKSKLLIFTKCDLADSKSVQEWKNFFESQGSFVFLIKNKTMPIISEIIKLINSITAEKQLRDKNRGIVNPQINALVIGVPNVGKSTVISRLAKGKELKIGNKPGVTRGMQRINLDKNITLIDTPGILPAKFSNEKEAVNLAAINAIKREVIPKERFVCLLLQNLYNNYQEILETFFEEKFNYSKPLALEDSIKMLESMARKNKWSVIDGVWDIERVMEVFISELFKNKLENISFENPDFLKMKISKTIQLTDALVKFDQNIREQHQVEIISGSDEVGRGAMAGPVVVASVILPKDYSNINIKDSKLLSQKQREELYKEIIDVAICYEIEIIDHVKVDLINPKQASRQGMIETISRLSVKPELALVDAEKITIENLNVIPLIKGDYLSQSIAAASIIAKVTRDNIMSEFSKMYPGYDLEKHKGYCTLRHQQLTRELGVLPIHRKSYQPINKILKEVNVMKFNKDNEVYKSWIENNFLDSKIKEQLLTASDEELSAAFGLELEFGTAGIRGILGAGPGRFNQYTVKKVTISYAKLLIKKYPNDLNRGVVIGHDNRYQSAEFANLAAEILTSFGIKAYLFENNAMKPTPVVSFATKHLNCIGGIVITASHNPAQYNGYKIYDEFGCQLMPADTDVIADEMTRIEDIIGWSYKLNEKLLDTVGLSTIGAYSEMVANLQFYKKSSRDNFKIVYSNVNGTGIEFAPPLLKKYGYDVIQVEEHAFEDPSFKNVGNPNPEFAPAWEWPIKYAIKHKANLIVINDPDADRIGIAIPDPKKPNEFIRLSGNETGALLINWKLSQQKLSQTIPENPALYSSFVTSDLGDRIANEEYGVKVIKTLTGFKWMGGEILKEPERGLNFVFAYEESFGYVLDSSTRDKDGIQAAIMLSEATWFYKTQNKTLLDVLDDIYKQFGYYYTDTINLNFKPEEMKSKVDPIMKKLRNEPFATLGGLNVENIEDYIDGLYNMPGQDLLKFYFDDNSWLAVRPSGTEPKIKIYYVVVDKSMSKAQAKFNKLHAELSKFLEI